MSEQLIGFEPSLLSNVPLYVQVADRLSGAIEQGVWKAPQALPAERQLADLLRVSRVTARKAIEVLCERGMLTRKRGSGNYVAPRPQLQPPDMSNFSVQLRERGFTPGSRWLARDTGIATPQEMVALGLPAGARVARLKRLRTADQTVIAIENTTLSIACLPDPEAVDDSLYDYLSVRDTRPGRALQHIAAVNATDEQARLLDIAPGAALLSITRVDYREGGPAIELRQSYCLSEYYTFVSELRC